MDRFLVEADRQVAGVAVREPGGFRFVCANPEFASIDGRIFKETSSLARSVADVVVVNRLGARTPGLQ